MILSIQGTTAAYLVMGIAAMAAWGITGNVRWVEFYFRVPGAFVLVFLSATSLILCRRVQREFSPAEPMYRAWYLIFISAACDLIGAIFVQFLSASQAYNPLAYAHWWSPELAVSLRQFGQVIGGSLRFAFLAAGLFQALRIYRKFGFLARLTIADWALLAAAGAYVLREAADLAYAIHNGKHPSTGEILGWPTDPYPGHSPFEAVILAELNGHSLNTELFGWSTGSLCLIAIFIFFGRWRKPDGLMLAVIAGVLLAYAPYWGNGGPDFGARYWFLILVPCLALSARGLELLEAGLKSPARADARATLAVTALCALALVNYFPWRSVDKYHNYLRMRADVRELASQHHFGKSLVLIRGDRFPDYMSAAIYNPLDLRADAPIYVWDRNEEVRSKILSLYPDRPVWVLEGPTVTHAGYRIAAGPLTAEAKP